MKEKIEEIKNKFENVNAESLENIEKVRIEFLGKKGLIANLLTEFRNVTEEEKREFGKKINLLKNEINEFVETKIKQLKEKEINEKLNNEKIDVSLPGTKLHIGKSNILESVVEKLEGTFLSLGFDILEGPEIESDLYNFEMLNVPKGHPARDAQDTFYITHEMLLRSQTSPVQIRTMLNNTEKGPIRMVSVGKTYRRDNDDAQHSHQFTQMEGLVIDKDISLSDLKGALDYIISTLFGNIESRFRPSFYPFTEPSVEFDIKCHVCKGTGCALCKNIGWITVGGAGMVHPNVLKAGGYDPEKMSGYAFGFGIERLTMIKYGITDLRVVYSNDLRIENMDIREEVTHEN